MIITIAAIAPRERAELEFEVSETELVVVEVSVVMLVVAVNGVLVERIVDCVLLAIDEELEVCGVTWNVVEPELPEFSGSPEYAAVIVTWVLTSVAEGR